MIPRIDVSPLPCSPPLCDQGDTLQPRQLDASHWIPEPEVEVWRRARDVLQVWKCGAGPGTYGSPLTP